MMGVIYKLTSPSGKSYIGQTRNSFDTRWKQHIRDANCNSILPIHVAIRKYGPENFVNQILEEIPNAELNTKEQYYIQKYDTYNNGYNCTLGGEGNCKIPDDIIIKLWENGLCSADIARELKVQGHTIENRIKSLYSDEEIQQRRYSAIGKKRQLDDDNIKTLWDQGYSVTQISKALFYDRHTVSRVLQRFGITKEQLEYSRRIHSGDNKNLPIIQLDKNGNFIKEWDSISEAARQLKLQSSNICKVLKHERNTTGGYIFKYKEQI